MTDSSDRETPVDPHATHDGGMRVVRIIPDLAVADIEATADFYAGFLGLTRQDLGLDWVTR